MKCTGFNLNPIKFDPIINTLYNIIDHYEQLIGPDVYSVFYYAGHGIEVYGSCYLLPVDVPENYSI